MRYTENLNLKKPEQTEFYDVDDFNENADIIDTELMNRLKVTGGEMTGSITVKNTEILHRDVNNSFLSICGGKNWRDGAYAILHGSTADEKGVFNLGSYDGNLEVNLIGKPTGELTWNSKNIVRSINNIPANVDGDVVIDIPKPVIATQQEAEVGMDNTKHMTPLRVKQSILKNAGATVIESYRNGTEWYRVWSDGWLEQGGESTAYNKQTHKNLTMTLNKPFIDTNYTVNLTIKAPNSNMWGNMADGTHIKSVNTTDFVFRYEDCYEGYLGNGVTIYWSACGQGA